MHKIIQNKKMYVYFSYFKFNISIIHVKYQVTYSTVVGDMLHANFGLWGGHVAIDRVVRDALRSQPTFGNPFHMYENLKIPKRSSMNFSKEIGDLLFVRELMAFALKHILLYIIFHFHPSNLSIAFVSVA